MGTKNSITGLNTKIKFQADEISCLQRTLEITREKLVRARLEIEYQKRHVKRLKEKLNESVGN